jgi:hypothetical protein
VLAAVRQASDTRTTCRTGSRSAYQDVSETVTAWLPSSGAPGNSQNSALPVLMPCPLK